ncbi:MAG: hypothetical protein WDW38_009856 [Sanguina aurantia]
MPAKFYPHLLTSVCLSLAEFVSNLSRTCDFWLRATGIYGAYKVTQIRGGLMKLTGSDDKVIQEEVWDKQHAWAGDQMYKMCIDLRGFYLKAGQFIGSRGDFMPEQICRKLALLCDKVPPMPIEQARAAIQRELGIQRLEDVFEWIDLEEPLGSASIAQVHKAKLRRFTNAELSQSRRTAYSSNSLRDHVMQAGEDVWAVSNLSGTSYKELQQLNKGVDLSNLKPGQVLSTRVLSGLQHYTDASEARTSSGSSSSSSSSNGDDSGARSSRRTHTTSAERKQGRGGGGGSSSGGEWVKGGDMTVVKGGGQGAAVAALMHATAVRKVPEGGLVAVKVQYPNALPMMLQDLVNLRAASYYLSKTEIKFDLVSAIDELHKQIKLEFDFTREAHVMDTIAHHLRDHSSHVAVPRSVPGLVTPRLLVMSFLEGVPLTEAAKHMTSLAGWKREAAKKLILSRWETYAFRVVGERCHPGNILIGKGGSIGLLDYGQSKQLPDTHRLAFARLIVALHKANKAGVSSALDDMGVVTALNDTEIRTRMAYGMFDTRGKVDPFDPDSPIKKSAITTFPQDMFFVLRVVQLLRGLSNGKGMPDFSSVYALHIGSVAVA